MELVNEYNTEEKLYYVANLSFFETIGPPTLKLYEAYNNFLIDVDEFIFSDVDEIIKAENDFAIGVINDLFFRDHFDDLVYFFTMIGAYRTAFLMLSQNIVSDPTLKNVYDLLIYRGEYDVFNKFYAAENDAGNRSNYISKQFDLYINYDYNFMRQIYENVLGETRLPGNSDDFKPKMKTFLQNYVSYDNLYEILKFFFDENKQLTYRQGYKIFSNEMNHYGWGPEMMEQRNLLFRHLVLKNPDFNIYEQDLETELLQYITEYEREFNANRTQSIQRHSLRRALSPDFHHGLISSREYPRSLSDRNSYRFRHQIYSEIIQELNILRAQKLKFERKLQFDGIEPTIPNLLERRRRYILSGEGDEQEDLSEGNFE